MQVSKAKRKDPWAGFKRNSLVKSEKPHIKRYKIDSFPADTKDKPDPQLCVLNVEVKSLEDEITTRNNIGYRSTRINQKMLLCQYTMNEQGHY